jgi:outer membrane protein OmpA-like peptidoglycan-associated protein
MNRLLLLFLICLACISFSSTAQNLVPNPGFEMVERLPDESNRGIHNTKYWRTPTFASPDYYHAEGDHITGVPKNDFGIQSPHSGNAYAGICITKHYIEYIAVNLTDTLEREQEYQVELYISRANKSVTSIDEFGVLFTNKIKWSLDLKGIAQKPSVDFVGKKKYKDKRNWIKLSGTYQAKGFETTIIIGHFIYNHPGGHNLPRHYYIDDVSVTRVGKENDADPKPEVKSILPLTDKKGEIPETFAPEVGKAMTLNTIFFASNESELLAGSFTELDKLAEYLSEHLTTTIEISGHTDNTGNEAQNKKLSEARAKAISEYLVSKGIDSSRIQYKGYGSAKPVAINSSEEGKLLNRRVEFMIIKSDD